MADENNNFVFSNTQRLKPNNSTRVIPRIAENNISHVSEFILQAREYKSAEYGGGRWGGAWLCIWMIVFVFLLFGVLMILSQELRQEVLVDYWKLSLISLLAVFLAFCPFFIIWRREFPVCFNRSNRKVYFWVKGQLAQVDWDEIEAYAKLSRSGAPVKEQILVFNIFYTDPDTKQTKKHNVTIPRTDYWDKDDPVAGTKALWEYIYLFMEQGKQALPNEKIESAGVSLMTSLIENNPFPHKGLDWIGVLIHVILLPITIPLYFITVPTDVVYTFLDRTLPKRKPPKALLEACEAK